MMKPIPWVGFSLLAFLMVGSSSWGVPETKDQTLAALRKKAVSKNWTFRLGETHISHLPIEQITGYKKNPQLREGAKYWTPTTRMDLPKQWDWRFMGVVTEIRDQAQPQYCGSCWAFGTVASFESAILIKDGIHPIHIAEQQLVSCRPSYGTCEGGDFAFGFYTNLGANYNSEFPYEAADVSCNSSAPQHEKAADWGYVGGSDRGPTTDEIKAAIYKYGPVAATISASGAWQYYKGGVYNECNNNSVNHIISIVGWEDDQQAWIIKNSHGTDWGEDGFMRIKYTGDDGEKCNNVGDQAAYVIYKK